MTSPPFQPRAAAAWRSSRSSGRISPLAWLVLGNLAAILLILALAGLSVHASRENFRERARLVADNLARSLAQSIAGRLATIDQTLQSVRLGMLEAGSAAGPEGFARLLERQRGTAPNVDVLRVFDHDGTPFQHPGDQAPGEGALAAYRLAHDDPTDRLHVSGPVELPANGRWVLLLSRRLQEGEQAGVVQAEVDLDRFRRQLAAVDVGRYGAATLRSATMQLIARHTGQQDRPAPIGSTSVSAELQAAVLVRPDSGSFIARTPLDGIERATAYYRLPDAGWLVLVGLGTADFLAPWHSQVRQVGALSGLLAVAVIIASTAVYRGWRQVAASRAAAEADARWHRALLRTASDGIHVLDRHGRLVELSDSFSRMLGYRRDEMLGMHISEWAVSVPPGDLDFGLTWQQGFRLKGVHRRRDGQSIDVEVTGTVIQIEAAQWLFCASRDVTERNQTARELQTHREELERLVARRTAELQAGEARFRAFMDATPATAWVKDRQGRMAYANAAWMQAFGLLHGQCAGRSTFELLPADGASALQENDDAVLRSGRPVERVESIGHPDGHVHHWQTVKFPLSGPDGAPQIGGIGIDITAQVEAEAERRAALLREQALRDAAERQAAHLREAIHERDEFVRVMAHEVRQPLNNASAALESAAGELAPGLRVEPEQAMQRVRRAQGVISQIVGALDNTLAATALLTSSNERVTGHDADVGVLIDLSLADLPAAQRQRVQTERISPTRTASMDSGLMRLALRNVLSNALAYSPAGSTVVLRVTDSDEPLALVFEVLDAGPGVRNDLLPRLFERGVRGHQDLPGHGIGLYVVRRVMELHGGTVDLRRNQPVGTVFRLFLPQDR